jgi:hypothetical protein
MGRLGGYRVPVFAMASARRACRLLSASATRAILLADPLALSACRPAVRRVSALRRPT